MIKNTKTRHHLYIVHDGKQIFYCGNSQRGAKEVAKKQGIQVIFVTTMTLGPTSYSAKEIGEFRKNMYNMWEFVDYSKPFG